MRIDRAERMYQSDPVFHNLVDSMIQGMCGMSYTPGELRDAAMLAAVMFEARLSRRKVKQGGEG